MVIHQGGEVDIQKGGEVDMTPLPLSLPTSGQAATSFDPATAANLHDLFNPKRETFSASQQEQQQDRPPEMSAERIMMDSHAFVSSSGGVPGAVDGFAYPTMPDRTDTDSANQSAARQSWVMPQLSHTSSQRQNQMQPIQMQPILSANHRHQPGGGGVGVAGAGDISGQTFARDGQREDPQAQSNPTIEQMQQYNLMLRHQIKSSQLSAPNQQVPSEEQIQRFNWTLQHQHQRQIVSHELTLEEIRQRPRQLQTAVSNEARSADFAPIAPPAAAVDPSAHAWAQQVHAKPVPATKAKRKRKKKAKDAPKQPM
jgi:hypothetical protein